MTYSRDQAGKIQDKPKVLHSARKQKGAFLKKRWDVSKEYRSQPKSTSQSPNKGGTTS